MTGTENGWSKVTIGGTSGYIRSDYVSGGADSKTGYIKGHGCAYALRREHDQLHPRRV